MEYTVHEVAKLSGVTIKTLYHYQKIGLLMPERTGENGYRYYGEQQLQKLQQILFYRELDFPLEQIKAAMQSEPSRLRCLYEQKSLLKAQEQRLGHILHTLDEAIVCTEKGVTMSTEKMFIGLNKQEWEGALQSQNEHLQENYSFSIDTGNIDADAMNEKANEAANFMAFMAKALTDGKSVNDEVVRDAIRKHIQFMKKDMEIDAAGFAAQSRFLMSDDFHRQMMESQQTGLSYYICFAAESYALDGLVDVGAFIRRFQEESDASGQSEAERLKAQAAKQKTETCKRLDGLRMQIFAAEKELESDLPRLERIAAQKKLNTLQKELKQGEQSLFFDGLKIEQALEEQLAALENKSGYTADVVREFLIEVEGK